MWNLGRKTFKIRSLLFIFQNVETKFEIVDLIVESLKKELINFTWISKNQRMDWKKKIGILIFYCPIFVYQFFQILMWIQKNFRIINERLNVERPNLRELLK